MLCSQLQSCPDANTDLMRFEIRFPAGLMSAMTCCICSQPQKAVDRAHFSGGFSFLVSGEFLSYRFAVGCSKQKSDRPKTEVFSFGRFAAGFSVAFRAKIFV